MKTHKHLYPLITDFENLYLASDARQTLPVGKDLAGFLRRDGNVMPECFYRASRMTVDLTCLSVSWIPARSTRE